MKLILQELRKLNIKRCPNCQEFKSLDSFFKDNSKPSKLSCYCKECGKKRFRSDPTTAKKAHYKKQYGITLEDYNTLFNNQNGHCAICNLHQSELSRALAVDHCHITGKIRGLLCSNCNTSLGLLKDSVLNFEKAIKYLTKTK